MFDNHTHTEFSNLRLLDCINKPEVLIDRAIELGLSGICITDHECISSHVRVNKYAQKIKEEHPDFKIALGNEIYLTDTRESGQKYYHFILIAKDEIGYRYIKELSSIAWLNSYEDRRMERVPTLKTDLVRIMEKARGHIIGTTACIGGELGSSILKVLEEDSEEIRLKVNKFLGFCIDVFGKDDFYIECAPACSKEQVEVNKQLLIISQSLGIKMCVGSDAHYLAKDERYVHKAYLNSKGGEREVDSFYEYSYLQSEQEAREHLRASYEDIWIDWIFKCSEEMRESISDFSLLKPQSVTEVEVKDYPKKEIGEFKSYDNLNRLTTSDNIQERYWVNECFNALKDKSLLEDKRYVEELEEEARVKSIIGEKLGTCMFAYPNTLQHYIDMFWECGSTVGAGRGSSCAALNHYLLGITQLDPIEWNLPFFRYLNDERVELGDVDLDLAPSKIQKIFARIREERGELGLLQIATFGTETTKSAIQTACRGYRSEDYPDGIDVDEAQYLSSLVPVERGFLWPIHDVLYGNPEKGREPVKIFIQMISQYPGLVDIIERIENIINKRSSHASGVILFDEATIYDQIAIMRTPKGALITQWDLHDAEAAGCVKYDFLLTSVQDIIIQTIELLQKDRIIENDLSLREIYDKYLHPNVLPQEDMRMWDALANNEVLGCFQFDSPIGAAAARKIRPHTALEMADANGLMRLMTSEKGEETPLDKYVRFKNNISLWYAEMDKAGLTKDEQKVLEPYFLKSHGVPPSQEQLMTMLMDPEICGFTLAEANDARKIVGKKQMNKIPALQAKVLHQAKSPQLGEYVWRCGVGPQMGYSFSVIHALAYSFIGMQTLYLATHFNPVYWNTAYLIVNSGSIDPELEGQTDYTKLAKAIGEIKDAGIKMSLIDINRSEYSFTPDPKNNQILFGLKGVKNVNEDLINRIKENRPYESMIDFYNKVNPKKNEMIALIKGGAFDIFNDRKFNMAEFIWAICDKKQRLTLQNMSSLIKYSLIPREEPYLLPLRVYEFNRYLKNVCKTANKDKYKLDDRALAFLEEIDFYLSDLEFLGAKSWDKCYQKYMDMIRDFISKNKEQLLKDLNAYIFKDEWDNYADGTISAWEMETLGFYYNEHELKNINGTKYGLQQWSSIPQEPIVDKIYKRGRNEIPLFKLNKICGTVIAKDKTKAIVYLLTSEGVVTVKFRKEYFALFDRQISQKQADGKKKVVEKSWFTRGSKLIVQGIRREEDFIPKKYASTPGHQLYKIEKVLENGDLEITSERAKGEAIDSDE